MLVRWSTSTASGCRAPTSSRPRPGSLLASGPTCRISLEWAAASDRPPPLDLPGLARTLVDYCDAVGVERATFVGNSLGCAVIAELTASFPERIERAVMVSPAGGPNNQPLVRAVGQMAIDALREPPSMVALAARDYLRFGVIAGASLFRAMIRYPTLERLPKLVVPVLVIVGRRDPLVRIERLHVLGILPHVDAVAVPGAHALNYSSPALISELVEAHVAGEPLTAGTGPRRRVEVLAIPSTAAGDLAELIARRR